MGSSNESFYDTIQNLLDRMKKNHEAGKGINLSARELDALAISYLGEIWDEPDPRTKD